jgi:hypothetical protein
VLFKSGVAMTAIADVGAHESSVTDARSRIQPFLILIVALTVLRLATASTLPLSFDEAYFWLWSKHLSVSYFEHPPLIAIAIRAGTAIFGDTSLGVRLLSLSASVAASWAVWRAAFLQFEDSLRAWTACAYFNLTLMVASQGVGATPDIFVMTASAFLLLSLGHLERGQDGRWWLLAAFALGAALLAKYTAFFLVGSVCIWLVLSPPGRRWLRSPWPYGAAVLAMLCFVPNLVWNEVHGWISFKYQFGRIAAGHLSPRHFLEFFLGQFALASPAILLLAVMALVRETRNGFSSKFLPLLAFVWPAALYFSLHSLHDRVQGNWPSFIYPALAIFAASAATSGAEPVGRVRSWLSRLAIPFAAVILALSYLQTWTGLLPLGKADPIARMTAVGFEPVAKRIAVFAGDERAAGLMTTRYVNTGWLAFYVRPSLPVLQAAEEYRWTDSDVAGPDLLDRPLLYITQNPQRELRLVRRDFTEVKFETCLPRMWSGVTVESFCLYMLGGYHGHAGAAPIPVAFDPAPAVHLLHPPEQ